MVIYKITNLLKEKIYIGQTKQPIEKCFLQHFKEDSLLGQAMHECELENFMIEIIERCESQQQLNEREIFWINALNSKQPNGYNVASGGSGYITIKKNEFFHEKNICANIRNFLKKKFAIELDCLHPVIVVTNQEKLNLWRVGKVGK